MQLSSVRSHAVWLIMQCSYYRSSSLRSYVTLPRSGGLNTWSRSIASFLVPLDGEPLVSVSPPLHHAYQRPSIRRIDLRSPPSICASSTNSRCTLLLRKCACPSLPVKPSPAQLALLCRRCSYLGAEFPKVLEKPNVEYKQANLTIPGAYP